MTGRNLLAYPLFYAAAWAPSLAGLGLGVTVVRSLATSAVPPLAVLALGGLALLAVRAVSRLPLLRTTNGGRRSLQDACWEAADRVADWAGWEPEEIDGA